MKSNIRTHFGAWALAATASLLLVGAAFADEETTVEKELHIHRLQSDDTAPYDAFAYLNRIQVAPAEGQSAMDYAGIIMYSRLTNEEGRVQMKGVDGFGRTEYLGYKTFMRTWNDGTSASIGACVLCHTPEDFTDNAEHIVDKTSEPAITASLRNLTKSDKEIEAAIRKKIEMAGEARTEGSNLDPALKPMNLTDDDIINLVAFIRSLREIPAEDFRKLILNEHLIDTSDMRERL